MALFPRRGLCMAYGGGLGGRAFVCVRRRHHFGRHRYGFLDAQDGWAGREHEEAS